MNQRKTIGKILRGGIRLHFQERRKTENFGKLENLENPRAAQIFCQHCICFLRRARGKNRKSFHYKVQIKLKNFEPENFKLRGKFLQISAAWPLVVILGKL